MASIIWHDSAREHLHAIFDYYYTNISKQTAYGILKDVLISVQNLENFPTIGQKEEILQHRSYEYRYILSRKRYKTIYFIKGEECHIVAIWDTLRNPKFLNPFVPVD